MLKKLKRFFKKKNKYVDNYCVYIVGKKSIVHLD